MLLATTAVGCSALIGFAAHRASLCNVRAVSELMFEGRSQMLSSLMQAVLWMTTLTGTMVFFGLIPSPVWMRMPLSWAWAGGLFFGVGAALNGGCSLSTLTRLADGDLGMLATLAGFLLGVSTWIGAESTHWPAMLVPVASPWLRWPMVSPWLLALLLLWSAYRIVALWRLLPKHWALRKLILAPTYHSSASAALMGLAAGLLYASQGAWSYTNYLRTSVLHAVQASQAPSAWHGLLVLGLLGGLAASALQRKSFGWRHPRSAAGWLRHAGGGILMGAGASMLPGGNDTLLLGSLPTMTLAAICGYLSMLIGIALMLHLLPFVHRLQPAVTCLASGGTEATSKRDTRSRA